MLGAERFVVEIKTTAALQHPHILPLFDSGSADGFLFYVMPYIEGETLRTKLDRETQLGIDEAVRITRDVADALDYAHRHGVIHRDIKPENILLHDGRPMVADFGIALALSAAAGGRMTETGMSLGTPHYMSPEQATADKEITGRSDIYSLGSVLYEMLTGESAAHRLLGAADHHEDHRRAGRAGDQVPEVGAAERGGGGGEVAGEVAGRSVRERQGVRRGAGESGVHPRGAGGGGGGGGRGGGAGGGAGGGGGGPAGWVGGGGRGGGAAPGAGGARGGRFFGGRGVLVFPGGAGRPAISAGGRPLVFLGGGGGRRVFFWGGLEGLVVHTIPGTDNATSPFFSPDGKWIGFFAGAGLQKVQLTGGAATTVSAMSVARGAAWTRGDVILIGTPIQMLAVPAAGGTPRPVAPLDTAHGETSQRFPLALADGETVLYTSSQAGGGGSQARSG